MTNSKKLGMVIMAVLLGLSVMVFAVDKESGDKTHWGVAAVRANGDYDTDGGVALAGDVAAVNVVATGEVTVDGKYAATGSDATTGLMIQVGTCTNGQTITFSPVFGGTPRIVGNHSEDAGADATIEFTGTTATSTVCVATADKTIDYIAIGARP